MKVTGQENIGALRGAGQAEAAASRRAGDSATTSSATMETDAAGSSLVLSPRSEEASRVVEIARSAPDFRIDKVEQARADLDAGALKPDAMAIAKSMAQEIF